MMTFIAILLTILVLTNEAALKLIGALIILAIYLLVGLVILAVGLFLIGIIFASF